MSKILLSNVTKIFRFDNKNIQVLKGITLEIIKGEIILLTGKSGSGKTTLLNMITGIDKPTSGTVSIFDTEIDNLDSGKLVKWRGANLGIVFQFFQLIPTLTVIENVLLPMELAGRIRPDQRKPKALELLQKTDILNLQNKFPQTISGGEKQRVAIARALANNPDLIVADEPTGNLDTENSEKVQRLFGTLADEGKTIVYITHERDLYFDYSKKCELKDGIIESITSGKR
jgi:putative ABC transport system ATP-binding protein